MKTVSVLSTISSNTFDASMEESFARMVNTPLKSRVLRPTFGSRMHELIDKVMDEQWKLKFRKYLFECFFDENNEPWDERFVVKNVDIINVDATTGHVTATVNFEGFDMQTQLGGF